MARGISPLVLVLRIEWEYDVREETTRLRKGRARSMGRKGGNKKGGRSQKPIKGFRPGKEPAHVKRQRAKAQLGDDAGWAQKAMVDAVAGRSREEVRSMLVRWTLGLLIGAIVLGVLGLFLYGWSPVAGIATHLVAISLLVLWYRVRKQGARLAEMADNLGLN